MNVSEFYYDLPEELIAQTPLEDRTSSRLLILDKETGEIVTDVAVQVEEPKFDAKPNKEEDKGDEE